MELYEVEVRVVVHCASADEAREVALAELSDPDDRIIGAVSDATPISLYSARGDEVLSHAVRHDYNPVEKPVAHLATPRVPFEPEKET